MNTGTILDVLNPTTLSTQTSGVTLADGVANTVSSVLVYQVPEGDVIAMARWVHLLLKLNDDATPTEMPRDTRFSFAFIPAGADDDRPIPLGPPMHQYHKWYGLSTTLQTNELYKSGLIKSVTRGIPLIVFNQDDQLIVQVKSSGTLDISESTIEIPIYYGKPGTINQELALRKAETGF